MFPYNHSYIDIPVQSTLLHLLLQDDSYAVLTHDLEAVFWQLLINHYPLETSYRWLMQRDSIPPDLYQRQDYYFDARRIVYWFWSSLCEPQLYGAPQQRHVNGILHPQLSERLVCALTQGSFTMAINTWYSTCIAWLQVCNVDWYYDEVKKYPYLQLWKQGEEQEIPRYLAGYMALMYF